MFEVAGVDVPSTASVEVAARSGVDVATLSSVVEAIASDVDVASSAVAEDDPAESDSVFGVDVALDVSAASIWVDEVASVDVASDTTCGDEVASSEDSD